MKTRVITGIVLALVLVPVFYFGGTLLNITLLLLTMGASYELFKMFDKDKKVPLYVMVATIMISGLFYLLIMNISQDLFIMEMSWVFLASVTILIIGALLLVFVEEFTAETFGHYLMSILYPAIGFGCIYILRADDLLTIGFLFMITIFTDVFAYAVGVKFGKHRLAPKISPKKSWEGSIGGTVIAGILTMIYLEVFNVNFLGSLEMTFFVSIIVIIFISVMGQIGDLVASKLKRHYGIKDYSNLFPGHGGVMDRFDSVLFAGMVLFVIVTGAGLL